MLLHQKRRQLTLSLKAHYQKRENPKLLIKKAIGAAALPEGLIKYNFMQSRTSNTSALSAKNRFKVKCIPRLLVFRTTVG